MYVYLVFDRVIAIIIVCMLLCRRCTQVCSRAQVDATAKRCMCADATPSPYKAIDATHRVMAFICTMNTYIYAYAYSCIDERITDVCLPHRRAHVCARTRVCSCSPAHAYPRRNMRALSAGVDRVWLGSQALNGASVFNQDLSAWNVARVSTFANMFDSAMAFSSSNKGLVYCAWGATFRASYPGFSSGLCFFATGFRPLNAPASSGAAVTILGTGFGAVDTSPSAYISGQPCATTSWTSATQLVCSASAPTVAAGALPPVRPSPCSDDG
jgi:hypothetical protein